MSAGGFWRDAPHVTAIDILGPDPAVYMSHPECGAQNRIHPRWTGVCHRCHRIVEVPERLRRILAAMTEDPER